MPSVPMLIASLTPTVLNLDTCHNVFLCRLHRLQDPTPTLANDPGLCTWALPSMCDVTHAAYFLYFFAATMTGGALT